MEAASLPLPPGRRSLAASYRERQRARRAMRLMSDAERFDRAADRLSAQVDPSAWQVAHLRRQAEQLRELAEREHPQLISAA